MPYVEAIYGIKQVKMGSGDNRALAFQLVCIITFKNFLLLFLVSRLVSCFLFFVCRTKNVGLNLGLKTQISQIVLIMSKPLA